MNKALPVTCNILIIEDASLISGILNRLMRGCHYSVFPMTSSSNDGNKEFEHNAPSLAVIDYDLESGPPLDALQALSFLKIPFIVISGASSAEAGTEGRLDKETLTRAILCGVKRLLKANVTNAAGSA